MRDARADLTLAGPAARSYLTYEPYYGLKEKAFSLSADPRFLYKSRTHAPVFDALRAGIRRREGIIVLTGEPGTGKTTLCRSVLGALDRKTFCTIVPDPFVSREDLLKMLLIDFGVMSVDDLKSGRLNAATRPELSYPLYDFLKSLVPLQAYAVLILDEAQNLTSQLLEEIRILADLEGPEKLLQLVLVGQPELHDKLKDPALRQVDQRISVRCSLETLDEDAVPEYLSHRLIIAGGGADRPEFVPAAIELIFRSSKGNPRLLNLIADKSLHRAHLERTWLITTEIVAAALDELGYAKPAPHKPAPAAEVNVPVTGAPMAPVPPIPAPVLLIASPSPDAPALADFTEEDPNDLTQVPHDLIDEEAHAPVPDAAEVPARRGNRRLRHAAILALAGFALIMAGLAANEWELRREELTHPLQLPPLPSPPKQHVRSGAAPVIPLAASFAYVVP
jgi:type II secretory pathway predicted ATPase ExeA